MTSPQDFRFSIYVKKNKLSISFIQAVINNFALEVMKIGDRNYQKYFRKNMIIGLKKMKKDKYYHPFLKTSLSVKDTKKQNLRGK